MAEPRFAAGRVLPRCQAEEGSELTPTGEGAGVLDVAMIADAMTGSTPGIVINRLAVSPALTDAASSLSIPRSLIQRVDLADKRTKCAAHAIGDDDLAILVETMRLRPKAWLTRPAAQ
jgi:hypothetical protein